MSGHTCGGQWAACGSWFSPPTCGVEGFVAVLLFAEPSHLYLNKCSNICDGLLSLSLFPFLSLFPSLPFSSLLFSRQHLMQPVLA